MSNAEAERPPATARQEPKDRPPETIELRRALAAVEGPRRFAPKLVALAVVLAAAVGFWQWRRLHPPVKPARFLVDEATVGDVVEQIEATGTLQPVTQVQVGAQISGRIAKRYVDFNSVVKKGDLLAELDPTLYSTNASADAARVESARAAVFGDEAGLALAKTNHERIARLRAEGLAGEAELVSAKGAVDAAEAKLRGSRASLGLAEASLRTATTNLAYTKIYAPIDGVVIARNVDVGQTVAASFQTPVLFTIAQDLRSMIVLADVDEADLGRLGRAKDPEVEVQVAAYPGKRFPGRLTEIRFNATTTQGVVTYPAVIAVENPKLELRPGMTATAWIRTAHERGAIRVPNAALRFKPSPPLGPDGKPLPAKPEPPPPSGKGRVFLAGDTAEAEPTARVIEIGPSDGLFTVVRAGLVAGEKVVVDESDDDSKKKPKSPF
jgi:HlyD family secretion protein